MPELAVIVPTYNERENVLPLTAALRQALKGIDYEVVFVDDDSPDSTAEVVRGLSFEDPRVRIVHRVHRRGLASAAVEGMMATNAPFLAVIDGDLQHDETLLPEMLRLLRAGGLDLVVGSRHLDGGSMGEFSATRVALSQLGRRLSALVCRAHLSDPMSGFFMLTRSYLNEVVRSLSLVGFKILLDLVAAASRPVVIREIGYTFRNRQRGESKLDLLVGLEYLELLLDKLFGEWVPVRYMLFGLVGAVGVVAQLLLVVLLMSAARLPFGPAQLYSSILVIALNYTLNNQMTFRARRLHGWRWLSGLVLFLAACSVGLFSNVIAAGALRQLGLQLPLASLAGIVIGSIWNYGVSSILVWRVNRRR
ncbi:MAG: glycosyltransferase family 2 protein [Candidatus Solibacter usitatus]|nr:glycosyltransferase family 2 protein [Candidatus Solibacter usitatus]